MRMKILGKICEKKSESLPKNTNNCQYLQNFAKNWEYLPIIAIKCEKFQNIHQYMEKL